jgi:YHS domain-containing protein
MRVSLDRCFYCDAKMKGEDRAYFFCNAKVKSKEGANATVVEGYFCNDECLSEFLVNRFPGVTKMMPEKG